MNKKADLIWTAGIFDGAGCIHINRQRVESRTDLRTDAFRLYVKVTMGHEPTVTRVHETLRTGSVHPHVPRRTSVNASYSWMAAARQAEAALKLMKPYLFTKLDEVIIAEEFFAIPPHLIGGRGGNAPKPPDLVDAYLRCYWRLRMAKSRWVFYKRALSRRDRREIRRLGL